MVASGDKKHADDIERDANAPIKPREGKKESCKADKVDDNKGSNGYNAVAGTVLGRHKSTQ